MCNRYIQRIGEKTLSTLLWCVYVMLSLVKYPLVDVQVLQFIGQQNYIICGFAHFGHVSKTNTVALYVDATV